MAGRREKVDIEAEIREDELPAIFRKLIGDVRSDRKLLLRDKAYESPAQLRAFVAQYLQQRLVDIVKIFAQATVDTYQLAQSTATQQYKFQKFVSRELDIDDGGPDVDPDLLTNLQEAFYALASLLEKKLPDDKEVQDAFNAAAAYMADVSAELMGKPSDRDDDDDDDRDDDDRDDDDRSEDADEEPEEPEVPVESEEPETKSGEPKASGSVKASGTKAPKAPKTPKTSDKNDAPGAD